ncbi:MAG: hypothetical protein HRU40_08740 [Saprospiraceae bacterium]|nr:hypothetical protein [Saprospiraceae bacterium]
MFFSFLNKNKKPLSLDTRMRSAWHRQFSLILGAIKLVLLSAISMLIYLYFGSAIEGMFHKSEPLTTQQEKVLNAKRIQRQMEAEQEKIENGIHLATGLKVAEGWDVVRTTCTGCHSAALVTQNKATYSGWKEMIVWMQETQGLWDLGENEEVILAYLTNHYAPNEAGRRSGLNIEDIEWYILDF